MWRYHRVLPPPSLGLLCMRSHNIIGKSPIVMWPIRIDASTFSIHTVGPGGTIWYDPKLTIDWWVIELPTGETISVEEALEMPYHDHKREEYGVEI